MPTTISDAVLRPRAHAMYQSNPARLRCSRRIGQRRRLLHTGTAHRCPASPTGFAIPECFTKNSESRQSRNSLNAAPQVITDASSAVLNTWRQARWFKRSPVLRSTTAEGLRDAEHDQLGERDAFDKQQRAIGTEDAERALGFACPIGRQDTGGRFDEAKVCVGRRCQERGVPQPGADDDDEGAEQRYGFEAAAPNPPYQGDCPARHGW